MINEFTIVTIDDTRAEKKQQIRQSLSYREAFVDCVDGKNPESLKKARDKWKEIEFPGPFKAGEFGIFFSMLNVWEYAAENDGVLCFEDDAMIGHDFQSELERRVEGLPRTADFVAVWSPDNQRGDYYSVTGYNKKGEPSGDGLQRKFHNSIFNFGHHSLSRVWHGYGNVCIYFTKSGGKRLIDYAKRMGMFTPVDCFMYIAAHTGNVAGYCFNPELEPIVKYNWDAPTTIHRTRWGSLEELMNE